MIAQRKRRQSRGLRVCKLAPLLLLLLFALTIACMHISQESSETKLPPLKAAVIDGLKGFSNPRFIEETSNILSQNGFSVDYYGYENVTVGLYERLPSLGYSLIVLRVHCGPLLYAMPNGTKTVSRDIILFSTEDYEEAKYRQYQLTGLLAKGTIVNEERMYFAIPPQFVYNAMQGRFHDTIIILNSCYGLFGESMAKAFTSRGVSKFVGWDGEVTASHADEATLTLLKAHFDQRIPWEETLRGIAPDPAYGSFLHMYALGS